MSELINREVRVTSLVLVETINNFRREESKASGRPYKELPHKSFLTKIRKELEVFKTLGLGENECISVDEYMDRKGETRPCYSLNAQGVKLILDSCRTRDKLALKQVFDSMATGEEFSICVNRPEYEFVEGIINALKPFGINDFITQYWVCNKYRIDLYIPSLNVAIEFDEHGHRGYSYEQQEYRQKEIEGLLNCKFIRVNSDNNLFYNIGYVIQEMIPYIQRD